MENARSTDDQETLEVMASWWMDDGQGWFTQSQTITDWTRSFNPQVGGIVVNASLAPMSTSVVLSGNDRSTSLADLQHNPMKLYQKFPYQDFFDNADLSDSDDGTTVPFKVDDDRKRRVRETLVGLEERLKNHHQQLEDLRRRIPQPANLDKPTAYWRGQVHCSQNRGPWASSASSAPPPPSDFLPAC